MAYPDVCERWADGFLTVPAQKLGNERYHGHEHSDEAVLEDSEPDDLHPYQLCPLDLHNLSTHIEPRQPTPRGS